MINFVKRRYPFAKFLGAFKAKNNPFFVNNYQNYRVYQNPDNDEVMFWGKSPNEQRGIIHLNSELFKEIFYKEKERAVE